MSRGITNYQSYQKILRQLLIRLRSEAGLRQIDLANRLQVPQSFISKYEAGERRLDFIEVKQVCNAIGISLQDFSTMFEDALAKDENKL